MAMVLTIPVILDDYYESIEQDLFTTSNTQILDDCDYIIGEIAIGEWWDDYTKADIVALKRFRTTIKNNLISAVVLERK